MKKKTSKKKSSAAGARRQCPDLGWQDAMNDYCGKLAILAELLEVCGQPLTVETLEGIGYAIEQDVAAMKALLKQLEGR